MTDSFRPTLWHVTGDQVKAGHRHAAGARRLGRHRLPDRAFNLNGIVVKDAQALVVVQTNTGKLFRIKLGDDGDAIDEIDEIQGVSLPGGDGMILDRGQLVVVQGARRSCTSSSSRTAPARRAAGTQTSAQPATARRPSRGSASSTSS